MNNLQIKRGNVCIANLGEGVGREQRGTRPVVIIQNNVGNKFSPTVIVAVISSSKTKANIPTHVNVSKGEGGLNDDSIVMLEQIRTIDKSRLAKCIGSIDMKSVDSALKLSLGMRG